jgi:hypothetical protein
MAGLLSFRCGKFLDSKAQSGGIRHARTLPTRSRREQRKNPVTNRQTPPKSARVAQSEVVGLISSRSALGGRRSRSYSTQHKMNRPMRGINGMRRGSALPLCSVAGLFCPNRSCQFNVVPPMCKAGLYFVRLFARVLPTRRRWTCVQLSWYWLDGPRFNWTRKLALPVKATTFA